MPHDLMIECERRTLYKRDGEQVWDWKRVRVADLDASVSSSRYPLRALPGKVRLQKQPVDHGPQEHYSCQDSEGCPGGVHFQGTYRISSNPVV